MITKRLALFRITQLEKNWKQFIHAGYHDGFRVITVWRRLKINKSTKNLKFKKKWNSGNIDSEVGITFRCHHAGRNFQCDVVDDALVDVQGNGDFPGTVRARLH